MSRMFHNDKERLPGQSKKSVFRKVVINFDQLCEMIDHSYALVAKKVKETIE
ncbi:hypothetical protein [Pinibacter soli]|uniref:Uncharacterized protein n=1 Tax=Pinibacter soli TaxID=3044211 RepID=A0ABT6RDH5_9BACT|nr:hypothetical protein [Pinibacter soli]MDI3320619.1 hypothetical protein [Pinibacter soli]